LTKIYRIGHPEPAPEGIFFDIRLPYGEKEWSEPVL
jgi:hypothetical protein